MRFRDRRHPRRQCHLRPSLPGAGAITVRRFDDYVDQAGSRQGRARSGPRKRDHPGRCPQPRLRPGARAGRGRGLLEEVAGPGRMAGGADGRIRRGFLAMPAEVIRRPSAPTRNASCVRDPRTGRALQPLHPHRQHRGQGRRQGDRPRQRQVVRARLSDALYFWETDQNAAARLSRIKKKPLDQRMARLDHLNVIFHAKLGTQGERMERIAELAERTRAARRRRCRARRARRATRQGRSHHRNGRRVPGIAGRDGPLIRAAQGEDPSVAAADRGALQAARARATRADRARYRSRSRSPTSSIR